MYHLSVPKGRSIVPRLTPSPLLQSTLTSTSTQMVLEDVISLIMALPSYWQRSGPRGGSKVVSITLRFVSRRTWKLTYITSSTQVSTASTMHQWTMLSGAFIESGWKRSSPKIYLKSAFQMEPASKEDWELLGIHWQGQYFVNTCLL